MEFELGSTSIYADPGFSDADAMLVKARFATKIAEIIKRRRLKPVEAAVIVGYAATQSCQVCCVASSEAPAGRK